MKELLRNHRTVGYKVASVEVDGRELVILQTDVNKQEVAPAHLLMEVNEDQRRFDLKMRLVDPIQYGLFLGITPDELRSMFNTLLLVAQEALIDRAKTTRAATTEQATADSSQLLA